ncbi:MAG: hypothetical protein WC916_04235 [Candidatus Woesearchaeota archaeon]
MDKSQVKEYRERNGTAELKFTDGSQLILFPYRNWGNIEGFDSAVLYQGETLEALATERPSRYSRPEESGFWSKGTISQQQLAEYLTVAAQVGKQVYDDYEAKKIDEDTWRNQFWEFWIITSKSWMLLDSLKEGKKKVFNKNPGRYKDSIEEYSKK